MIDGIEPYVNVFADCRKSTYTLLIRRKIFTLCGVSAMVTHFRANANDYVICKRDTRRNFVRHIVRKGIYVNVGIYLADVARNSIDESKERTGLTVLVIACLTSRTGTAVAAVVFGDRDNVRRSIRSNHLKSILQDELICAFTRQTRLRVMSVGILNRSLAFEFCKVRGVRFKFRFGQELGKGMYHPAITANITCKATVLRIVLQFSSNEVTIYTLTYRPFRIPSRCVHRFTIFKGGRPAQADFSRNEHFLSGRNLFYVCRVESEAHRFKISVYAIEHASIITRDYEVVVNVLDDKAFFAQSVEINTFVCRSIGLT